MAAGRLRGEFAVPVDDAVTVFTDELEELSSVRCSVDHQGNSATVNVGFVELATWVYPTIAALLGLVLASFLVPDESLPAFLTGLEPLWGFQRWWALLFTAVVLVLCYALSQVTTIIPGGEINITPDGTDASNVEVRDVSEPYMYRALRNIVNKHDRHLSAARAEAQANQLTLGSVFGMGALGLGGLGRSGETGPQPATPHQSETHQSETQQPTPQPSTTPDSTPPASTDPGPVPDEVSTPPDELHAAPGEVVVIEDPPTVDEA